MEDGTSNAFRALITFKVVFQLYAGFEGGVAPYAGFHQTTLLYMNGKILDAIITEKSPFRSGNSLNPFGTWSYHEEASFG